MRNFHLPGRSAVYSQNGMVATSHPIAAQVALSTLKNGGNAVDAAVAAALVLPICEPHMTGLFGDMFALIKPGNSKRIVGLNSSGKSPKSLNSSFLCDQGFSKVDASSSHAVTLPGAVIGFETLINDFGKLGLPSACEPAIYYAEEGIPVSPRVAFDWGKSANVLSPVARDFYLLNGHAPKPGQLFRAPKQAEVLRLIAKLGATGFYQGEVAEDLIQSLNNIEGLHTVNDLADVSCEYVDPVSAKYKNMELFEMPPNGQGATALLLGKILSNLQTVGDLTYEVGRIHLEAEACKAAYKARNSFIADPNFLESSVEEFISDNFAKELANKINTSKATPNLEKPTEEMHLDTVLVSVVDKDLCATSLIFSIFHSFGSGHASEKFGLLFQNRGAGFTLERDHPNELLGNKRPLHTIIPAMARRENNDFISFGVMGGQYQPTGHIRVLSNMADYKMDLQTAIDHPRSFPDSTGLILEEGYDNEVARKLEGIGHKIVRPESPLGGAQAVLIDHDKGVLIGASDPRKDGLAIGY